MRSKEEKSVMDEGPHDIRMTAKEWVERIETLTDPAMLLVAAESLSGSSLVKADEKERVTIVLTSAQLVEMALTKYCELTGATAVALMEKVGDIVEKENQNSPSNRRDLLVLKLVAIDVVLNSGKMMEIQDLFLYLNANRMFLPMELLKIKLLDVRRAMDGLAETQKMQVAFQNTVAGVINSDK